MYVPNRNYLGNPIEFFRKARAVLAEYVDPYEMRRKAATVILKFSKVFYEGTHTFSTKFAQSGLKPAIKSLLCRHLAPRIIPDRMILVKFKKFYKKYYIRVMLATMVSMAASGTIPVIEDYIA